MKKSPILFTYAGFYGKICESDFRIIDSDFNYYEVNMNYYIAYIISCWGNVRNGLLLGTFVYIIIFATLWANQKSRRNLKLKYIAEWLFCIYCGSILSMTGMLNLRINGIRFHDLSYCLIPFKLGVFQPMVLNFILFLPFGFLLPLAMYRHKGVRGASATKHGWTWYHALIVGFVVSLVIEIIQLFFGRYAEVDDVIMNALGTVGGYSLCAIVLQLFKRPGRALGWLAIWIVSVVMGYLLIKYLVTGCFGLGF